MISTWISTKSAYEKSVEYCIEIRRTVLDFFHVLCCLVEQESAQISVEDLQSSEVLHFQALYIIFLYAVHVQPFPASPP